MDQEVFEQLCAQYRFHETKGIGTMGEKGIHAVLKKYYQPDESLHEIHIGRYIADAVTQDGMILEIQTQGFSAIKKKLDTFLAAYEVTIIYPVAAERHVTFFNPETGELGQRRKDRRHADEWQIFKELVTIREYLKSPNLHFLIPILQTEEYRIKGDRRNARYDRLPTAMIKEVSIFTPMDYSHFLPENLPSPFTSADLSSAFNIPLPVAQRALYTLYWANIVIRDGKKGNRYLYIKNPLIFRKT